MESYPDRGVVNNMLIIQEILILGRIALLFTTTFFANILLNIVGYCISKVNQASLMRGFLSMCVCQKSIRLMSPDAFQRSKTPSADTNTLLAKFNLII